MKLNTYRFCYDRPPLSQKHKSGWIRCFKLDIYIFREYNIYFVSQVFIDRVLFMQWAILFCKAHWRMIQNYRMQKPSQKFPVLHLSSLLHQKYNENHSVVNAYTYIYIYKDMSFLCVVYIIYALCIIHSHCYVCWTKSSMCCMLSLRKKRDKQKI